MNGPEESDLPGQNPYLELAEQNSSAERVWTHPTKPEIQQNAECNLKDYSVSEHDLPLSEVCQKVIEPISYMTKGRMCFKLRAEDVKNVLKYAPMS